MPHSANGIWWHFYHLWICSIALFGYVCTSAHAVPFCLGWIAINIICSESNSFFYSVGQSSWCLPWLHGEMWEVSSPWSLCIFIRTLLLKWFVYLPGAEGEKVNETECPLTGSVSQWICDFLNKWIEEWKIKQVRHNTCSWEFVTSLKSKIYINRYNHNKWTFVPNVTRQQRN